MTADDVARFAERLEAREGRVVETSAAEATGAIDDAVESPSVGVPIPFAGVSLPAATRRFERTSDLDAATGVTPARFGIAAYGTVAIDVDAAGGDPVSLFPDHHVAVLAASDLAPDMPAAMARLAGDVGSVVFETGPSATADMGELVYGVHGPGAVTVVVVTDR